MCTSSQPKVDQSAVDAAKQKPQYLRNPWLDGLSIQSGAESGGRNSLVIAPGTTKPAPGVLPPMRGAHPIQNPSNLGIGSRSGGLASYGIGLGDIGAAAFSGDFSSMRAKAGLA